MLAAILTIDKDRLREVSPHALLVENVRDYVKACHVLRAALHAPSDIAPQDVSPIEVCVRHRAASAWLTQRAVQWGARVEVRQHTPRAELRERWKIEVPTEVSDAEIYESRLLDEKIEAQPGQSFEDALLEHFFSRELVALTLPLARLAALLNDYEEGKWKEGRKRPLAATALHHRLELWEKAASNEALRTLVRRLRDQPGQLRSSLCSYKILRSYGAPLGEKVLGKATWATFRKARIDLDGLQLQSAEIGDAAIEVDYYLAAQKRLLCDSESVAALTEQMSGHLSREFYVLDDVLQEHPEWLSAALVHQMERRFAPLRAQLGDQLAMLRKRIQPLYPPAPNSQWTVKEWLAWVRNHYMPYYAWLEAQNRSDEAVANYATQFADWFYENYLALKNGEPQSFSFSALYGERDRIKAEGALSLVVLVDNCNWVHFEELKNLFQEQGLYCEAEEPLLSSIPTATEVGKAGLVAMNGDQVDHPTDSYPILVQKTWSPFLNGKTARYLANIGQLQDLRALEHDVLFLNFLPIDHALHEDSQQTGRPHTEVVRGVLKTLAEATGDFAKRFSVRERLRVYVLSDHGSTRISQGVVNVLDQKFYKGLALDKHHRYLALSDEKFLDLPQVASAQCYLVGRQQFGTHKNYLAARGYYRFIQTSDNFYVHGGLTPEEVVVPFARFSFEALQPVPLTVRLVESEFRYAVKSKVILEVGNPNDFTVTQLELQLMDAESETAMLDSLSSKAVTQLEFPTTFRKTPGSNNTRLLTVRVRFECQGQHFAPEDMTVEVTMKTLMEVKDDDFDF
ncbi:hypothetical protein IAD21_06459 (plasmid) [Abditibacteriota bacterium]|nr:hypothetical protein IAD21_06459 [Abditibacteriota bacterium]